MTAPDITAIRAKAKMWHLPAGIADDIIALCDALDAAQTSGCPRGEDCDMTLAYMVGRGRKDDDMAVLRAENELMRTALTKINVGDGWAAQIARAALGQEGMRDGDG